jgi:hypothetical protein
LGLQSRKEAPEKSEDCMESSDQATIVEIIESSSEEEQD